MLHTTNEHLKATGNFRWTICALIFFATTINYLDRTVISLLKPQLETEFNWSESDYANIVIAFQVAYALGMVSFGRLIDIWGTKLGYILSISVWSVAAMAHAGVRSTLGFIVARAALGVSEAGNFPAANKSVAEWFPKKERALATGIFNAGTNMGAIVAPLSVPFIAEEIGWRWTFFLTGIIGFVWIIFWYTIYDTPQKSKKVSKEELTYITHDTEENSLSEAKNYSWISLLGYKQTWAFALGKFLTDPVWWFFLFWLPAFLKAQYNVTGTDIAWPVSLVYFMAFAGSVIGGWLPLYFIKRGWPIVKARKTSMLLYACCVVPVLFAQYLGTINMWLAVLVIGVATSAHQAWSANLFTTVSDMFPKQAVGSVTGIGGMMGAFGSVSISALAGQLFDYYRALGRIETGYFIVFCICSTLYLVAWLVMQLLTSSKTRTVEN